VTDEAPNGKASLPYKTKAEAKSVDLNTLPSV
jgi:hypothetical protein